MRKRSLRFLAIIANSVFAVACSGGSGGSTGTNATVAPPANSQSPPLSVTFDGPQTLEIGAYYAIGLDSNNVLTSFSVSPALPPGLQAIRSGQIMGTPTQLSPPVTYTMKADDGSGDPVTVTGQIEVVAGPLFYSTPTLLTAGVAMPPLVPKLVGTLQHFEVSPDLPPGLILNADTGVISGTPANPSPIRSFEITASGQLSQFRFGILLGVSDPSAAMTTATQSHSLCAYSGGFVGSYEGTGSDVAYGLVAVAFTPDGNGNFHTDDLSSNTGLSTDTDLGLRDQSGDFQMNISGDNAGTVTGKFVGTDWLEGDIQQGNVTRHFVAARMGGSPSAHLRFSGGFATVNNVYPVSFSTIDVDTAGNMTGIQYQFGTGLIVNTLSFAHLSSFTGSIKGSVATVNVGGSTSTGTYAAADMELDVGDPYDEEPGLFESGSSYFRAQGCLLN